MKEQTKLTVIVIFPSPFSLYCYGVDSTKLRNGEDYIQLDKVYFS